MRYGHFDNERREYVIERPDVPVSWTNYLGIKDLCTVISHNAGGYCFYQNAEHKRITRFRANGVPLDRPGHYVYLRDDDTGDYWSVSWQPVGKDLAKAKYECRHGLSYSKFSCDYSGIQAEQTLFIPPEDDVELWDVKLRNTGSAPRRLSVFGYVEFSFHHIEIDNQNLQMSLYASGSSYRDGIIEYDFFYEPATFHYFTADFAPDGFDSMRDAFLGSYRTETNPVAVERGECGGSVELGGNHCGALHKRIALAPGEEVRLVFMLGVGPRAKGQEIRSKYSHPERVDQAFADLRTYWDRKLAVFQCKTPHAGLDTMANIWTLYQAETCVVWSRFASFIEVGGRVGLGYRDTSQDVMSVVHTNPGKCRQRIVELLKAQVSMGYGLHLFDPDWFDPEKQKIPPFKSPTIVPTPDRKSMIHGLKDTCSDDVLWLVVSDLRVRQGDRRSGSVRRGSAIRGRGRGDGLRTPEAYARLLGGTGGADGHLQGTACGLERLPEPRRRRERDGEFPASLGAASVRGGGRIPGPRSEDVEKYGAMAERVRAACEKELWDGDWYLRGITAKGLKIGSHESDEGRVFLESNTWAVVSDAASPERARKCMDAVNEHLYSEYGIHLLWPAFSKPNDDIGFMGRVYKGIKENGAIFSHPNPWAIIAECKLGRGSRAMKFYDSLLPYNQNDKIEIREAEPYSYCQFVMGQDHTAFGRARHPWLTGSGGWNYTAVTRWMLGIRLSFSGLIVDPCIPCDWKEFQVTRQWRGATFEIKVRNPGGVEKGVRSVTLNGHSVDGPIPPQPAGSVNQVAIVMG